MTRFHTSTILLLITALYAWFCLDAPGRWIAIGAVLFAYVLLFGLGVSMPRLNWFVRSICRGHAKGNRVALTFDDGPDPSGTEALLDELSRQGIKAGFFPVGTKAEAHPEIVGKIDRAGHVVGNHSHRHLWWYNFLIGKALEREILNGQRVIEKAIGKTPSFFRPPAGLTNPHLSKVLKGLGLSMIGWDVRVFDTGKDGEKAALDVLKRVRDGSIILLHEGCRPPEDQVRMVRSIATGLHERGFSVIGLEEITGLSAYQSASPGPSPEASTLVAAWRQSALEGKGTRLRRFLGLWIASIPPGMRALQEKVDLSAFRERPSPRFLAGIGVMLFSYVLGWPMVGLFSFLAAYLKAPLLLIGGPISYGISHIVWMLGIYLAGRQSLRYTELFLLWCLRRAVELLLGEESIDGDIFKGRDSDALPKAPED